MGNIIQYEGTNGNSSELNAFCRDLEDLFIEEPVTPGVKLATIFIGTICLLISIASYVYFIWNKNRYIMLQKRNTFLLTLIFLSFLMAITFSAHRVLVGAEKFSCRFLLITFPIQFVLITESNVGRVVSLLWRIRFNQRLIHETYIAMLHGHINVAVEKYVKHSSSEGEAKVNSYYAPVLKEISSEGATKETGVKSFTKKISNFGITCSPCLFYILRWKPSVELPKELQFSQFLASKLAANLVGIFFILLFYAIAIYEAYLFIPLGEDCFGCPVEAVFVKAPIAVIIVTALFYFYTLFRLRNIPDSLGIKKELVVVGTIYVVMNFVAIGFLRHAFPDIEEEGKFDYVLLVMPVFAFLSFYKFAYQVHIAKSKAKKVVLDAEGSLEQILKSNDGKKALVLFLASTLALETLMFYEAAKRYKNGYDGRKPRQNKLNATAIFDQFVKEDSFMEINIPGFVKKEIEISIEEDIVPKAIFDKASDEVFTLMANDIYPRFVQSTYYKAYLNEHQM